MLASLWTDIGSPIVFTLFGAALSLYVTVVVERYKRYQSILRDMAYERRHASGVPDSLDDLVRAHDEMFEYWRRIEHLRDDMNAEGQPKAAAEIGRLASFAYRTVGCIERMMKAVHRGNGQSASQFLLAFQIEYGSIMSKDFTRFEATIRRSWSVFLRPWPTPVLYDTVTEILVNYFENLPDL
jgi:hypothetical protein